MGELVTVHAGPIWEVELLKGRLAEDDIPAFVPDANAKVMDPFITGANALDVSLQVRAEDAAQATEIVQAYRAATRDDTAPAEDVDEHAVAARLAKKEKLGRRVRWLAILWVTAPVALLLGILYVGDMKPGEPRPESHGLTMGALFVAVIGTMFWMFFFQFTKW